MSSDLPLVGIVVPTRNNVRVLDACLASIMGQTYANTQLVVVDNNSTDGTPDVARRYTELVFNVGPERSSQRNFGARQAEAAEYVLFIDSDMVLSATVVEECVEHLGQNPEVDGVVIPEESFGAGFWSACKRLERSFYLGVAWVEAARFFRRSAFATVGGYDEAIIGVEDWDLSQRIREASPARRLGRVPSFIRHDEGRLGLRYLLKKKYYYAHHMGPYLRNPAHASDATAQMGLVTRYRLFFAKPGALFHDPVIGIGMLFMKTAEFAAGAVGVATAAVRKPRSITG